MKNKLKRFKSRAAFPANMAVGYIGSYLIHLFGVRFLLWTGRIPTSIREQLCRSCSEYTTLRGGVVGVERSRDQTKMAERLNGIKTSTNISFKTRNSYKNGASRTISCFESPSDSELLLALFMK